MQEKFQFDSHNSFCEAATDKRHRRRTRTVLAASVTGIAALGYFAGFIPFTNLGSQARAQLATTQSPQEPQEWKWADILPSRDLEWHKCYENKFDCARLDVRKETPK